MSKDPFEGSDFQPQSMNGWNYVNSNPIRFVDLSGNEPCDRGNWGDCPKPVPTNTSPIPTPSPTPTNLVPDRQLLEKTVRVNLFQTCPPQGQSVQPLPLSEALGTVVFGGNAVLTHGHFHRWNLASEVWFIDHQNQTTKVSRSDIHFLNRDAGTWILELPVQLSTPSAQLGNPGSISQGDLMQQVYLDDANNQFAVRTARVKQVVRSAVSSAWLFDSGMRINEGDSGGGVYSAGELVGNNWFIAPTSDGDWVSGFALLP